MWGKFITSIALCALSALSFFHETNFARAETELNRFISTLPPKAKYWFSAYNLCTILALERDVPFARNEEKIANSCRKELEFARADLSMLGVSASEIASTMKKFEEFSLKERELRYNQKPIPGFEIGPETKAVLACSEFIDEGVARYFACTDKALHGIIPFSDEPSNVIADGIIGVCEPVKSEFVRKAAQLCFQGNYGKAESAASRFVEKARSTALGKIVALRAEAKRRQLMSPQPATPAPERKPTDQGT